MKTKNLVSLWDLPIGISLLFHLVAFHRDLYSRYVIKRSDGDMLRTEFLHMVNALRRNITDKSKVWLMRSNKQHLSPKLQKSMYVWVFDPILWFWSLRRSDSRRSLETNCHAVKRIPMDPTCTIFDKNPQL